ncbi:hypothetical protein JCM14469_15920 [Desulfatiferula olefinivorans]
MKRRRYKVKGAAERDCPDPSMIGGTDPCTPGRGFVIIGSSSEPFDELSLVENIRRHDKSTPILMIAGQTSEKQMEAALDIGISGFIGLSPPSDILAHLKKHGAAPTEASCRDDASEGRFLVGSSPAMKAVNEHLDRIARTDSTVLITGETGTGKDLAAEYIHAKSPRRVHPLVSLNCTAFPESLLESELFGYEKGTFTNALTPRCGKFELAAGGTLFLDEIGDLALNAQAKLLRAIEKKEIWRIGGSRPVPTDFRLITATNGNLETMIGKGTFRNDLYYRLNIARVHLPPLRERPEDIEDLCRLALTRFNRKLGRAVVAVGSEVLDLFQRFSWPGNVRQLNNMIEAAFINATRDTLTLSDLPEAFRTMAGRSPESGNAEARHILRMLEESGMNKSLAARKMNISRMTLYRRMARCGLVDPAP